MMKRPTIWAAESHQRAPVDSGHLTLRQESMEAIGGKRVIVRNEYAAGVLRAQNCALGVVKTHAEFQGGLEGIVANKPQLGAN